MNVAFLLPIKQQLSLNTVSVRTWQGPDSFEAQENPMNPIMWMHQICNNYFIGKATALGRLS